MLRIRKEYDLKKLEKFGFKQHNFINTSFYKKELKEIDGLKTIIVGSDGEISININCVDNSVPNEIYDLIKADLVEKIEQ